MSTQYFKLTHHEGWHSTFAFRVFHRPSEEWVKMRWGFNAGVLLEEALDRARLFIESQSVSETIFFNREQPIRTLALRGINLPDTGVQMSLIGKVTASDQKQAEQAGREYARELASIFPHDFIIEPAETEIAFHQANGTHLFDQKPNIALIQREKVLIPPMRPHQQIQGMWQASNRSNEQIWRALSGTSRITMLNIMIQPSLLFENERKRLFEIKEAIGDTKKETSELHSYYPWVEEYVKRRLSPWKKFFLLQVHVLVDTVVDDSILRSIGSAITRDAANLTLPGYEVVHPASKDEEDEWRDNVQFLTLLPTRGMEDLADIDETFAVFRFPLRHEFGLPGANFVEHPDTGSGNP